MPPEKKDLERQDGSPKPPAEAPPENGEGGADGAGEDVEQLPEWAQKRIKGAEGAISDLKASTGAKSVKEIKEKFEAINGGKPAPKPAERQEEGDGSRVVTHEELAAFQKGYTPEELSVARSIRPGAKLGDALDDPTVKAAISGIRGERKTQGQIPEPSTRIPVVGGKSFSDLKPDEQKANYGKTVDALLQKGRNRGGRNVGQ